MWPHSIQIAVGDAVVGVGTDDDEIAALLARFAIPGAPASSTPRTPDFGLELHPPRPAHRAQPRALPSLQHGTLVIGRTTEVTALRDGLLRTLASVAAPSASPADGRLRLTGLPLLVEGGAVLAPPDLADRGSLRRLRAHGHVPVYVPSVEVDTTTLMLHIPAPFGTDSPPIDVPLLQWWLPLHADESTIAAAELTHAQLVAHATSRIAPPWFDDEVDGPSADAAATAALQALVALVARMPPQLGAFSR